jgi:hypothetical protein
MNEYTNLTNQIAGLREDVDSYQQVSRNIIDLGTREDLVLALTGSLAILNVLMDLLTGILADMMIANMNSEKD